jgi:hypothetical protein
MAGHHDDPEIAGVLFHFAEHGQAVDIRHPDVEHHDALLQPRQILQKGTCLGIRGRLVAKAQEERIEKLSNAPLVINDVDASVVGELAVGPAGPSRTAGLERQPP